MENKTNFSIEIYYGITITAENQEALKNYLYDMHSAFYELTDYYFNNNMRTLYEIARTELEELAKALNIINNHIK